MTDTVLERAADYLAEHGWVQGRMFESRSVEGPSAACVMGAIGVAGEMAIGMAALNDTHVAQVKLMHYLTTVEGFFFKGKLDGSNTHILEPLPCTCRLSRYALRHTRACRPLRMSQVHGRRP